jgi:uncharacterized protein YndB with AHSA1/START domain
MANKIIHALVIHASKQTVYEAITTQKGLSSWWTTDVKARAQEQSTIEFRFHDPFHPDMKITKLREAEKVEWECVAGADEWIGSTFVFELTKQDGDTQLKFVQKYEKKITDEAYGIYNFNWGYYLQSLKDFCESGSGKPYGRN